MTTTVSTTIMNNNDHAHEWVVFCTALATRSLMVQCIECGLNGTVDDPTKDEWSEAFFAPAKPYRWNNEARIRTSRVGPQEVIRATEGGRCECYTRFGIMEPMEYEHVPAALLMPTVPLKEDECEEFERLAELVRKNGLCSADFPMFVEEYQQRTGEEPSAVLRAVARRIEKFDGMSLHCSPSVVARVLTEWAASCRRESSPAPHGTCSAPTVDAVEEPAVGDAFVIYDPVGGSQKPQPEQPPEKPAEAPAPRYSDAFLSANMRWGYKNFLVEQVYKDGKPSGQYRVARRRSTPCWDMRLDIAWEATFPTREEAIEWGVRHTNRVQ